MSEGDRMGNIEHWTIYVCSCGYRSTGGCGTCRAWSYPARAMGPEMEAVEVVPAETVRGAVSERDAFRKTLEDVGRWLSSGNFAGWEMVVSEIEATLNHPGGQ